MRIPDTNSPPPPDTNKYEGMRGVETLTPTGALRWNNGVLEQGYRRTDGITMVWRPVPHAQ